MKKTLTILILIWVLAILSYVAGVYALTLIVRYVPALGPIVFVDSHGNSAFTLKSALLVPGGFMAVMLFCLAFDALCLGMDNSAIKRLVDGNSSSARVDRFYIILRLAGGLNVLIFVFSFGTLFWVVNHIHRHLNIAVLSHIHNWALQFLVVYLVNTLVAYWGHRLMHTPWFWEVHKVHHAAEEMNVVTPFRNHPVELVITTVMNAFPVALLGASPSVIITYYAANMIYQSLAHSEIRHKGKLWDIIWITPAAHRIHHSNRAEHFDKNFGIITLWDWLFATYQVPRDEKLTYGVDDGELFNRPSHLREIFDNARRWLMPALKRPAKPAANTAHPAPPAHGETVN
jgi:sterol desaturase/sphingolipid hydroxylase (fatty acid hydroxylase superfamily)